MSDNPGERIAEARRLRQQGTFRRRIIERIPKDIQFDVLKLECGHQTGLLATIDAEDGTINCNDCAQKWLDGEAG